LLKPLDLKLQKSTTDFSLSKNLKIDQEKNGYRFSMDPFLLCSEIPCLKKKTILDIGCGSGVISLVLKSKNPHIKVYGVEIQKELADIAVKNVLKNSMEHDITIICNDIKNINPTDLNGKIDIIVSNPPYKKQKSGRICPDRQKAIAKHEIMLNIEDFFICCKRLLQNSGKVYLIFPAERISDILINMEKNNIKPALIKFIYTKKKQNAKLVFVSGIKNRSQQPLIAPPLIIDQLGKTRINKS